MTKAAGIVPIYDGRVYLIKQPGKKPSDFGGKLNARELANLTDNVVFDGACRKAKEEGGFAAENIIKVVRKFHNAKCKYVIFVCEVNKEPVAVKAGTSIVQKQFGPDEWGLFPLGNYHFRLGSTPHIGRFLATYTKEEEPVETGPQSLSALGFHAA